MTTVADNIVATLKASGVRRIYGIPGDSLNGFTDAVRRAGTITWEHVRHEESAAFAAGAEAAITGDLAVGRRELRSGQPSSRQRSVRRAAKPRTRARGRRAHRPRRDWQ